jgi:ankyrin repeat protein
MGDDRQTWVMPLAIKSLKCPNCGSLDIDGSLHCLACGSRLVYDHAPSCPYCGYPCGIDTRYCRKCGNNLQIRCTSCWKELALDAEFCSDCGKKADRETFFLLSTLGRQSPDPGQILGFIERGADVDTPGKDSLTALHAIISLGNGELSRAALQASSGVNVKTGSSHGRKSPLMLAASKGDAPLASLLIQKGAAVNDRDARNRTPLHYGVCSRNAQLTRLLIQAGAEVNAKDSLEWTPLHYAALEELAEIVPILLEGGADIDATNDFIQTPLMLAIDSEEMVLLLTDLGADVNARDNRRWTPLHYASFGGFKRVVALLVQRGADIMAKDYGSEIPMVKAQNNGHTEIAEFFRALLKSHYKKR